MPAPILKTKRLILRQWKKEDLLPFFKINSDPRVMEFFPSPLNKEQNDKLAEKIQKELLEKNYGLWALEIPNIAPFIGFTGLHLAEFSAFFTPCIEIGWRLDHHFWNKGLATEAANACLDYGFVSLVLKEIVSFASHKNSRSIKIMKKLNMSNDPREKFIYPKFPENHPPQPFVLLPPG